MKILQITPHFSPNLGGVETHLNDLISALEKRGHNVFVLTYRPLQTKADWKIFEKRGKIRILRIPWIPGLFYSLVKRPLLEFLYLLPGIFIVTPLVILLEKPDVIHSHGLVAGTAGVFWGRIFGIRSVISTHNIYNIPETGVYRRYVTCLFNNASFVLCLSEQSAREIRVLTGESKNIKVFTYWIDLKRFKKIINAKVILGWSGKFVVLFVGRLVAEKGIQELLEAMKSWNKNIYLAIAGDGPLKDSVKSMKSNISNLIYLGKIGQENLSLYYSASDVLIIPSTHEEGFGRVILESLACGTPVIGARRGAIPEAMDDTVGELINITPENIRRSVELFYRNSDRLKKFSNNARKFAVEKYSENNVEEIIKSYTV